MHDDLSQINLQRDWCNCVCVCALAYYIRVRYAHTATLNDCKIVIDKWREQCAVHIA